MNLPTQTLNLIVNNEEKLRRPCEKVTREQSCSIAAHLFSFLYQHPELNGVGLAANQLGIYKQVAVVKIRGLRPIILANPKIIAGKNIIQSEEGCLSFPDLGLTCLRFGSIIVEDEYGLRKFQGEEAIVAEHEICHCHSLLMQDFQLRYNFGSIEFKRLMEKVGLW